MPIVREDECLCALNLVSDQPGAFTAEHVAFLEELTPHLAVAIEKARLFEQAAARAQRSEQLAELSRLVTESLDVGRVQQFVIQAGADLLGADLTSLYLVDEPGEWLDAGRDDRPGPGPPGQASKRRVRARLALAWHDDRPRRYDATHRITAVTSRPTRSWRTRTGPARTGIARS